MRQYADKDFVEMFIPSPEVKELIYKENRVFSDWEKAAIIWNSKFWLEEKLKGLEELKERTDDQKLIRQIDERINYENDAMKLFKENDGNFIYVLYSPVYSHPSDGFILGYYGSFDLAWKEGIDEGCGMDSFAIRKCQIIHENTSRIKTKIVMPIRDKDQRIRYNISEENLTQWIAGEMILTGRGNTVSFESSELSIDRFAAVNKVVNDRFECAFVNFPNPFNKIDNVRVIDLSGCKEDTFGVVVTSQDEWKALLDAASGSDSDYIYNEARLNVAEWSIHEQRVNEKTILPINITRNKTRYCNCFSDNCRVIVGHDYGAAVWMQPVIIDDVDRIMSDSVQEVGMEISVDTSFFNGILWEGFNRFFEPELNVNKKRFTKAFSDGGRFLTRFERDVLEPNIYTYESVNEIIKYFEDIVSSYEGRYHEALKMYEANEMIKIMELLKIMMKLSPEARYISVMS